MSIQLNGVDKLIKKLSKVSRIEAKNIIDNVADKLEEAIVNRAKQFSENEYKNIGKADVRNYGNSCFIDVGLNSSTAPFEEYKGLWYHNWGYNNWGHGGRYKGMYMGMHVMWFDEAVKSVERDSLEEIKRKVKAEFKAFK